ncbi:MAG: wbbL [Solirubrobacterales bacterium]|jgi:GT2 family glycosyltransferase|nr:wbbL [Solirubrobacterales bacterium]
MSAAPGRPAERVGDPALDVVIVSYRCRELLRGCLDALRAHPPHVGMSVIVVDNDSADGSAEMVRSEYPEVQLEASDRNLGFAAGTNRGARAGRAPLLLALNPDTAVTSGALDTALDAFSGRPEVAVVGPRLLRPDGTLDHASKRSFPTPLSALGHFTGIGRRRGARGALAAYRAPEVESGPVDAVNGAFMLMRREAFEQAGGFDEGYWMYMEDLDLCYRLVRKGWVTWYEPAATVIHVKSGTTGGARSPRLNWAFHRGMYRFYRRHYAPGRSPLVNAAVYVGVAVKLACAVAHSALSRSLARLRQRRRSVEARGGGTPSTSEDG